MIEDWSRLDSQVLGDYRIFRLREDTSRSPRTGREHNFFVLETGDWTNVIPITQNGQVVLIRQYRHGIESVTLEIPGGMVGPDDDDPVEAAERELLEETGYRAEKLIHIGTMAPNPAILDNYLHTFLAEDARPVASPQPEGTEDIEFDLVDISDIPELIASGQINHALVIAAFYFFDQYRKRNPKKLRTR
jgi:ADP-ribose pyrophosphatase